MKKILLIIACAVVVFSGKAQQPVLQQDTDSVKTINLMPVQTENSDSVKQIVQKLDSQKINEFSTFSAKAKVNSNMLPVTITANIRIQKDSIIWVSFTATMVITMEVGRAKITRDSVWFMDKVHKTITRRSIAFLQTLLKMPFTFDDVQNIILGNPLLLQDSVLSGSHLNNEWNISLGSDTLNNLITVQNQNDSTLLLTHSYLQDSTATENRTCDIAYSNPQLIQHNQYFSRTRNVTVTGNNSALQATLQFINFNFNQPVDFPFNIPNDYSEK